MSTNFQEQAEDVVFLSDRLTSEIVNDYIARRKHMVLVDGNVFQLYPGLFQNLNVYKLPEGEQAKTLAVYEDVVKALRAHEFTRNGVIVAVGGGAISDLAGFVASTYMRGVDLITIPTTLLAMCDAAIGGKNALNVSAKNELGTFYTASTVLIDIKFLTTLPVNAMKSGTGELLKYGIGFEPSMLDMLKNSTYDKVDTFLSLIRHAIWIKKDVVARDFRDGSVRKTLNFGHTLGHAVEFASGFGMSHGEAVAIGVYYMVKWAEREKKLTEEQVREIEHAYDYLGLPRYIPEHLSTELVFSYLSSDKKSLGREIDIVTIEEYGRLKLERMPIEDFRDKISVLDDMFRSSGRSNEAEKMVGKSHVVNEESDMTNGYNIMDEPIEIVNLRKNAVKEQTSLSDIERYLVNERDNAVNEETETMTPLTTHTASNSPTSLPDYSERTEVVIPVPASKSYAHRFLILAAVAETPTTIERLDGSEDLSTTIRALEIMTDASFVFSNDGSMVRIIPAACSLGADRVNNSRLNQEYSNQNNLYRKGVDSWNVNGNKGADVRENSRGMISVNFGESASTARFLIPFVGIYHSSPIEFRGKPSLERRPMDPILDILRAQGLLVSDSGRNTLPFIVDGRIKAGVFRPSGEMSSQFASGLLMAAPKFGGRSKIVLEDEQVSMPYIRTTLDAMKQMGVELDEQNGSYLICPSVYRTDKTLVVERDYSQAAFWLVAEVLRQERQERQLPPIRMPELNPTSLQADSAILRILGIAVTESGEVIRVELPKRRVDISHCPDLFPILAVYYSLSEGAEIFGTERLAYKESDRYLAMKEELERLGGSIEKTGSVVTISEKPLFAGRVTSHGDHRVAMALYILSLFVDGVDIVGGECIKKSYPKFLDHLGWVCEE